MNSIVATKQMFQVVFWSKTVYFFFYSFKSMIHDSNSPLYEGISTKIKNPDKTQKSQQNSEIPAKLRNLDQTQKFSKSVHKKQLYV